VTIFSYEQFDLSDIKTYPLSARQSKTHTATFVRPVAPGETIRKFVDSLPDILAGADFKTVVRAIVAARRNGGGVLWGLGAHVIKTGVGPALIQLMERGFVSALALNGAALIHDFEIALVGATSEDVDEALGPGRFGMAEETGRLLNEAIRKGVAEGLGIGQAVARFLTTTTASFASASVLATAARLDIPMTVHVAIGTDIIHMHPAASGAALGEGSLRDFRYFVTNVARLDRGVYLNCGSAVVLPEVFLKAVTLARNRGFALSELTTVNLDFMRMYRPLTNVVARPTVSSGRGYSLVGHHEIMIPLIAAAVLDLDNRENEAELRPTVTVDALASSDATASFEPIGCAGPYRTR
jgi:Arginine dihydrolase ArgZ-like, C-terminal, Rossmann fold